MAYFYAFAFNYFQITIKLFCSHTVEHLHNCHLFLSRRTVHILTLVRTSLQKQRPLQRFPKCQNDLSTTANFFNDWRKSQKFNPYGALMINLGNSNLIVFHLCWFSKHKLCTILIANIAILAHFFMLTIRFKTLFKFFRVLIAPSGGTVVTRAYIKESTYSWYIQSYSQHRKNLDLLEQGPRGISR